MAFAMVEQWNTEEFGVLFNATENNDRPPWSAPPVYTKAWRHIGKLVDDPTSRYYYPPSS